MQIEQAHKNLEKFQTAVQRFEAKYGQGFDAFRTSAMKTQLSFEAEQDYYDWELAVTGIADMQRDIARLRRSFSDQETETAEA